MYWEPQRGDNCRVHALNALFQGPAVTAESLITHTRAFDSFYGITTNSAGVGTDGYEAVQSDGRTLLSFVIETIDPKAVTYYIPISTMCSALARFKVTAIEELDTPSCLIFSARHVWCCRRDKTDPRVWWNLDSCTGPHQVTRLIPSRQDQQLGVILVFSKPVAKAWLLPVLKLELAAMLKQSNMFENFTSAFEGVETLLYTYRRLSAQCHGNDYAPQLPKRAPEHEIYSMLQEIFEDCV
jgi:hypothetical protein